MNWKTTSVLVLAGFSMALAVYVSTRLSADALNMAVGVMCGMAASVPVSVGLLLALLRKRERDADEDEAEEIMQDQPPNPWVPSPRPVQGQTPQIIVIAPPQGQSFPGQAGYGYTTGGAVPFNGYPTSMHEDVIDSRDWRIIGDDEA